MAKKLFINKAEIRRAERILKRLDKENNHISGQLESYTRCTVSYPDDRQSFFDRLWGALNIIQVLGLISYEEEDVLTRYFIDLSHKLRYESVNVEAK